MKMNVEKIDALEQVKSMLTNAYSAAEKQLRDPNSDPVSISTFLLTRISSITNEINSFISEEEESLEEQYQEWLQEQTEPKKEADFNPLMVQSAASIRKAFGDCWMQVRQTKGKWSEPECEISIQPDSHYTPNDIQLVLRSMGYTTTFESFMEAEQSNWVYFEVMRDGLVFKLSSTVSSIEPPELERFGEPAIDEALVRN
jgi:hypothetical protein